MTIADAAKPLTPQEAREALAAEWASFAPSTPEQIAEFYRRSEHLEADLEAFHTDPGRQEWTTNLVYAAKQCDAHVAVDVGSGAGHDLRALHDALPDLQLHGVEPNVGLWNRAADGAFMWHDAEEAPIEGADLISCFDVLEHVVNPEEFLGSIARRAKLGAVLLETCATFDCGTPLHLRENRGWKTGHALEAAGWEKIDDRGRLRAWQRVRTEPALQTGLLICAYRSISLPTVNSLLQLINDPANPLGWRISLNGEAGINRSRSILTSRWFTETADDVFLMVDDDIVFTPSDAERLVTMCRDGHDIICAAYPVRDGGHVALRGSGKGTLDFGPDFPPVEIRHASTGFLAVHRRVVEALAKTLPLCHGNQSWAFWPLFDFKVIPDEMTGGNNYLSEDWNFSEMAIQAGFKVWLAPSIRIKHLGMVPIHVGNMEAVHALF